MTLILPISSNKLNNPGHSFLHRVIAVDDAADEQTIIVLNNEVQIAIDIIAANLSGTNTGDETNGTILTKIGYTPENDANKATDFSTLNNTKYPTTQAVKTLVDASVVGLFDDRGQYNASSNLFPSTGGSGSAGAILKGDIWLISVAGTLGGVAVAIGDQVRALVDTPGQTASNWAISEANIGYVPENVANKDTDASLTANSDTKYASQKAVKTFVETLISGRQPLDLDLSAIAALSPADDDILMRIGGAWLNQTIAQHLAKLTRVVTYTDAATVTLNADTTDLGVLLTLSQTTNFANPTGTPYHGQLLQARIKSTTSRLLTWGSKFRGITGRPLPGATSGNSLTDFYEFLYNATDDKWELITRSPNIAKYYSASGQSGLNVGATTVVDWTATAFDTDPSWFNSSTDRWTPQVKGRYAVIFQLVWASDDPGPAGDFTEGRIIKNGVAVANNGGEIGFSIYGDSLQVATILEMNGTTDYLEWQILSPGACVSPILFGGQSLTYTAITYLGPI